MIVTSRGARAALSHRICTGIPRRRLGKLIAELAGPWVAGQESHLRERRGHDRQRAAGAGPDHQLVFTDRVIATLVILRFQLPHAALALFYEVDRSTITRAVHEIRPLLAARGFAVPQGPGLRLRTPADVFAHAAAEGVELRIDATEVRVRRPRANRPGRRAFVSGKMRQNTKKATVITDEKGRTLWAGAFRPGRRHDQTALKTEGICDLFERFPRSRPRSTPATGDWPSSSPTRSKHHRRSRRRMPLPRTWRPGRKRASSSPPSGSASSTPTPSTSSGGPSNAGSAAASTSTRPTRPSPAWYPTARPCGNQPPANPPGQHTPTSIAHHVVTRLDRGQVAVTGTVALLRR